MSHLSTREASCQKLTNGDPTRSIKALNEPSYGISVCLKSADRIVLEHLHFPYLSKSLGNIQSLILYHQSIHTQQCLLAIFLRSEFDPAIPTKISLFQGIRHSQCPKSFQLLHYGSDIRSCNLSRKRPYKKGARIRCKSIVRRLGDIKTTVNVDFNGLVADEAAGIVVKLLFLVRLEDGAELGLSSQEGTTSLTRRSILS
jgi:hypothetical protein